MTSTREECPANTLLATEDPTNVDQQSGASDTSLNPRDNLSTEGRSCLQKVKKKCQEYWMLTIACSLIVGGFLGYIIAFRVVAPRCRHFPPKFSNCPNKWIRYDAKCFFISRETKNWFTSLGFCQSEGGTLLTLDKETQEEILKIYDLKDEYWVGLTKESDNGKWKTLDGSEWNGPIEFDGQKRKCSVVESGKYFAVDCSTQRHWICVTFPKWGP